MRCWGGLPAHLTPRQGGRPMHASPRSASGCGARVGDVVRVSAPVARRRIWCGTWRPCARWRAAAAAASRWWTRGRRRALRAPRRSRARACAAATCPAAAACPPARRAARASSRLRGCAGGCAGPGVLLPAACVRLARHSGEVHSLCALITPVCIGVPCKSAVRRPAHQASGGG